jgi:hypothetical protein
MGFNFQNGTADCRKAGQSLSFGRENRLLATMSQLQSWISLYASRHLGPGVSPFDFFESLGRRLAGRLENGCSDAELEKSVKINVRYLVKQQKRENARKANQAVPLAEAGELPDPRSGGMEQVFQRREADELLKHFDEEVAGWIAKLYGFGCEELPRVQLAKKLGIRRNTLDARLAREFRKLRAKLATSDDRSYDA